jgi:hypothetical protein
MVSNDWWKSTSAADDGSVRTETDSWLDDFDFDEYDADDEGDFVGGLWNRYGTRSTDSAIRVSQALRLVQGFVDTFATGDRPYRVTFDENVVTAGTDFVGRSIVISHAPLFDSTIDSATAELVLTAMAAHESSHVRYGRKTSAAVRKEWMHSPDLPRAMRVSNILDDVRIERRYVADYPGYSHVFAPAIRYVAESGLRKSGASAYVARRLDPISVLVGAVRYPDFVDWTDRETIRDRWTEWSTRGTVNDRVATHVDAVREALAMLDEPTPEDEPQQAETPDQSDDESAETGESSGQQDEQVPQTESPESGDREGESEQATSGGSGEQEPEGTESLGIPECFADGVSAAAETNDESATAMGSDEAQQAAEAAKALVETGADDDYGPVRGEVYWGPGGIAKRRRDVRHDGSASAAIRAAFARSRTGHYATSRNLKSGRVDSRSLSRIASSDYRLFAKRTAPSEGRYSVWLMVDCSRSMSGFPIANAASVASALAAASRSIPNMRLSIWGWTTAFRFGWDSSGAGARFGAVRVWSTGDPIANVGYLPSVPMGGTPDAETLRWAARAIVAESRPGETPVILLASDGQGTLAAQPELIESVRRSGVEVVSVALGTLNPKTQESMYGARGFLPWNGSIRAMARPLGDLLARVVTGRSLR